MPQVYRPADANSAGLPAAPATPTSLAERVPIYLLIGLYLVFVVRAAVITDDAYITLRTVENFNAGRGLTWNPAERVQAYTHPLWMFVLSGAFALTREVYFTTLAVSVGVSLAAVAVLVGKLAASPHSGLLAVGVLAFSKAYVDFSTSGLENPLTHLLMFAFFGVWVASRPVARHGQTVAATCLPEPESVRGDCLPMPPSAIWFRSRSAGERLLPLALLASAMILNRLDCALLVGPPLVVGFLAARSFRAVGWVLLGLTPIVAWEIFSLLYYGFPIPNTAYAKLNNGIATGALIEQGFYYFVNSIREDAVTMLAITAGLVVAFVQRRVTTVATAIGICLYLVYIARIGGDFMSGRLFTPPLAAAVAILAATPVSARAAYVGVAICAIAAATASRGVFRPVLESGYFHMDGRGIADERSWYGPYTGLAERAAGRISGEHRGVVQARAAREAGERVVVGENAGFLGYYAGNAIHVVDEPALTDAFLARLPPRAEMRWRIGHFARDLPAGYHQTLESGSNRLADAGLREYYDRLRRVIRGPLLDGERLREIMRFNLGANEHLLDEHRAAIRAATSVN